MKTSVLLAFLVATITVLPARAADHPIGGPRRPSTAATTEAAAPTGAPGQAKGSGRIALEVNGVPVSLKTYRRVIREAEPAWAQLLAMFPLDVMHRGGRTKEEFLFLHEYAEPLIMRTRHAAEAAALEASALECYRRAKAGEDMSLLVMKYGTDPSLAQAKGDTGLLGFSDLAHPLNRLAWSADVGDILPPVQTAYGYHVLKVTEIAPPRDVPVGDGGGTRHLPELRRTKQAVLLWNSAHVDQDPGFNTLLRELKSLAAEVEIAVLDDRLCSALPNWCAARPDVWRGTSTPPRPMEAPADGSPVVAPQR